MCITEGKIPPPRPERVTLTPSSPGTLRAVRLAAVVAGLPPCPGCLSRPKTCNRKYPPLVEKLQVSEKRHDRVSCRRYRLGDKTMDESFFFGIWGEPLVQPRAAEPRHRSGESKPAAPPQPAPTRSRMVGPIQAQP